MNDLIDRQAAICIASGYCHPANIAKELAKLPSEQPERIRGRWEYRGKQLAPHNTIWWYQCSVCGGNAINGGILTDFCPHCGADMREDQNE